MLDRRLQSALKQSPNRTLKQGEQKLVPAETRETKSTTPTLQQQATNTNPTFLGTLVEDVEWGARPMKVCKSPGAHTLDAQQEPTMTPSQRREKIAKWLRDKPKLVLHVGTRGQGNVVTGNINQNTPKQAESKLRDQEISNLRNTVAMLPHQAAQRNQAASTDQTAPGQQGIQVQNPNLNRSSDLQELSTTTTSWTQDTELVTLPRGKETLEVYLGATPGALRRTRTRVNNQPYRRNQLEREGSNRTKEWQQPGGIKTAVIMYNRCVILAMAGVTPEETSIDLTNMLVERNEGNWTTWEQKWTNKNINSLPKYLDDPSKDEGERAIASNRYQLTGSQGTWRQQVNLDLRLIKDKQEKGVIFGQVINWRKGLHKCLQYEGGIPQIQKDYQDPEEALQTWNNEPLITRH